MPIKKNKEPEVKEGLLYKGKPLLRRGSLLYYGNADDKYIVSMQINESTQLIDLDIATNITVQLQTNEIPGKERVLKSAERDGLYEALDLGAFWLEEALSEEA